MSLEDSSSQSKESSTEESAPFFIECSSWLPQPPFIHTGHDTILLNNETRHVCCRNYELQRLCNVLHEFPRMTSICFHWDKGLPSGFSTQFLAPLLAHRYEQITYIDLSHCDIRSDVAPSLVSLCSMYSLKTLIVSDNAIATGTRVLCDYLAQSNQSSLQYLALRNNFVHDVEDWKSIARLLKSNKTLRYLDVSRNRIVGAEDNGKITDNHKKYVQSILSVLGNALSDSKTLRHFNFTGCLLEHEQSLIFSNYSSSDSMERVTQSLFQNNFSIVEFSFGYENDIHKSFLRRNCELFRLSHLRRRMCNAMISFLCQETIPFYVLINVFDWLIFIEQDAFFDKENTHCRADFERIESYFAVEKVDWLQKMSRFAQAKKIKQLDT